jgi:hypothetical protein
MRPLPVGIAASTPRPAGMVPMTDDRGLAVPDIASRERTHEGRIP